jgi:hypothetical protein
MHPHPPIRRLVFALTAFAASAPVLAAGRALAPGPWGGEKVILEVVAEGADVEFECARGRIGAPIELDGNGDFDLPGSFGAESRGPTRDRAGAATETRYRGHVEGDTMTLTVSVDGKQMGPYTLTRERRPILKKCK